MASAKQSSPKQHKEVSVNKNEDPRKRKRTVPMEVLSFGYSRTGTMTMKAALETLGIPTWHWVTMSENTPDFAMWTEALQAKFETGKPFGRAEFDNLLGNWGATTDQPAALMAEELIAAYPNAKVILIERDIDRWYKSYCETVINGTANPFIPLASMIDKPYLGQMRAQSELIVKHCFDVQEPFTKYGLIPNSAYFDAWKANAKSAYEAHNEMIKRITPKDRLLLFQLDEGWDPLCKFLNKTVPDVPFPRVNETAAVQEKINLYIAQSYKRSLISFLRKAAPAIVVLLATLVWWKMR